MTRYQYKAATASGTVVDGVLSGASQRDVVDQLRAQNQIPIRIVEFRDVPKISTARRLRKRYRSRVGSQQVAEFTRELATLLKAGMPLDKAVGVLADFSTNDAFIAITRDIQKRLQQGSTFSDAVEEHVALFGRFYVNLLRAGESGGALEEILQQLARHIERAAQLRADLKSALTYPALLVIVAFLSILVLLGYVIPQFTQIFEGVEQELPAATKVTVAAGEFVKSWGWLVLIGMTFLAMVFRRQLDRPEKARRWHRFLLGLPLIGDILTKFEIARFSRTLSLLLRNGLPLLKALGIVRESMSNLVLADEIGDVEKGVKEGARLAEPLSRSKYVPSFAVQMVNVGEESGDLAEVLEQVADTYDRATESTMKRALTILEPMLILVLGGVIAGVIISILVAIVGINDLVI